MKTPDELLKQAQDTRNDLNDRDEILKAVLDLIDGIRKRKFKDWDVDTLSRIAGELAMYLVNLGEMVADATLVANSAYIYRKWYYATEYRRLRDETDFKIEDVKMGADVSASEKYEQQLLSQHYADTLKALYENVERIISVIQSRMKHAESQRMETNLSVHNDGDSR